jgi:hypothetical protein
LLTDRDVGFVPAVTNANGTPAGAWAATLVPIPNAVELNLYRNPATGKLVHLVNGRFFEEKDPYMALTILEASNLSALRLAEPAQTHDYMNDIYQGETWYQNQRVISQNQDAIDEMRRFRQDYERNTLNH